MGKKTIYKSLTSVLCAVMLITSLPHFGISFNVFAEGDDENPTPQEITITGKWNTNAVAYALDPTSENPNGVIDFDSTRTEPFALTHTSGAPAAPVYINYIVNFPSGTEKTVTIDVAPGFTWFSNGAEALQGTDGTSYATVSALQQDDGDKVYPSTTRTEKYNSGSYTYSISGDVTGLNIPIAIKIDDNAFFLDETTIENAVVVTATNAEGLQATNSIAIVRDQFAINTYARNVATNATKGAIAAGATGTAFTVNTRYQDSINVYYEWAECTFTLPAGVSLAKDDNGNYLPTVSSGTSYNTYAKAGYNVISETPNADGTTTVVYKKDYIFDSCIGCQPRIVIDSDYALDTAVIRCESITYKPTTADAITVYPSGSNGNITYNIIPDAEQMNASTNTYQEIIPNINYTDAHYCLGRYHIQNNGTQPSAPKIIHLDFSQNTDLFGVDFVMLVGQKSKPVGTIRYSIYDYDTDTIDDNNGNFYECNISGSYSTAGAYNLTANQLGLGENQYIAELYYELDYAGDSTDGRERFGLRAGDKGCSQVLNYNSFGGRFFDFDAMPRTSGTAVRSMGIEISNKYPDNDGTDVTTGYVNLFISTPRSNNENYMNNPSPSTVAYAGNQLTLSVEVGCRQVSNTPNPYVAAFDTSPIIYIRDVYSEGDTPTLSESDIHIINNDGVDIMTQYRNDINVSTYKDNTGHIVYRIDTSGIINDTSLTYPANFSAAVGFFDRDAKEHKLKVSWTYNVPVACSDSAAYNLNDVVFISSSYTSAAAGNNNNSSFANYSDPFSVAQPGDKKVLKANNITSAVNTTFQVVCLDDISIATSGIRRDDALTHSFESWPDNNSGYYVGVEPNVPYIIRNEVYNNSGRPTSTDSNTLNYIYIPIPHEGQDWGVVNSGSTLSGGPTTYFTYTMKLTNAIANPDETVFTFEYANVDLVSNGITSTTTDTALGDILRGLPASTWDSTFDSNKDYNLIRVTIRGLADMDDSPAPDLDIYLKPIMNNENQLGNVNYYRALYFESIYTPSGVFRQKWAESNTFATQLTYGQISGYVWVDANANNTKDLTEDGLEDITVTLSDSNGVYDTATTDSDGHYAFTNLPSGTYSIRYDGGFEGYRASQINASTSDFDDSDAVAHLDSDGNIEYAYISNLQMPYYTHTSSGDHANFDYSYEYFGLVPYVTVDYRLISGSQTPDGVSAPTSDSMISGTAYTASMPSDVEGYIFDGWYTNQILTRSFTDGSSVTANTTLYGKWSHITYDIAFNSNIPQGASTASGITGTMSNQSFEYTVAQNLTANAFDLPGYEFVGWNTAANASGTSYSDEDEILNLSSTNNDEIILYAQWAPKTYVVTYNDNYTNGPYSTANATFDGQPVTIPGAPATRDGYAFAGWNTASDGTGTTYTADQEVNNISVTASDITLYAKWVPNSYTVIYSTNANGVTGNVASQPMNYGETGTISSADDLSKLGYAFIGWNTEDDGSGTTYQPGDTFSNLTADNGAEVTLYAQWAPITYTIKYDGNGATGTINGATMDDTPAVYDQNVTLSTNTFEREGYTFEGWNTASNGSGTAYLDEDAVINLSADGSDVTLYAQWTPITYTIKYDGNGATGTINGATMDDTSAVYDQNVTLRTNSFERTGYEFIGWSTDNLATTAAYDNNEEVSNLTSSDEITLYAVWAPITYSVVFDANGGDGSMADQTLTYDRGEALSESNFTMDDHFFLGWSTDSSATVAEYENSEEVINLCENQGDLITLYAVWHEGAYIEVTTIGEGIASTPSNFVMTGSDADVVITPDDGYRVASVVINGTEYDRNGLTFSNGDFILTMEDVQGMNEVEVEFEIKPTFDDCSLVLDDGENSEFYVGDNIPFEAFGVWEDDATLLEGDVKYVPYHWHHSDPSGDWDGKDDSTYAYSASFSRSAAGTYTLHVDFDKYVYTNGAWVRSSMETLSVNYVVKNREVTPVPTPTQTPEPTTVPKNDSEETTPTATPTPASSVAATGEAISIKVIAAIGMISMAIVILFIGIERKKRENN